jgi:hypothetical protein
LGHLSKVSIQVRGSLEVFVTSLFFTVKVVSPMPDPSWRTIPCRLSAAAYSIHSQLPSISAGCSSIHNLKTHHPVVTGTHLTWHEIWYWGILLQFVKPFNFWLKSGSNNECFAWRHIMIFCTDLQHNSCWDKTCFKEKF